MTMAHPPSSSTAVAPWDGDTGLGDFKPEDASMPRITIDHDNAVFKDSQTESTFDELECVILGLVKTRIMWGPLEEEKSAPLCKSPNTTQGFPLVDPEVPKSKQFPWKAQEVFTEADLRAVRLEDGQTSQPLLNCASCHFKEWGTDPSGNRPWCSEEWMFPILYKDAEGMWTPALFAAKRSAMKPSKNYVTPFASARRPMFTVITRISLESFKRGKVEYCVPRFEKTGPSDATQHAEYYAGYVSARELISRLPIQRTDEDGAPTVDTVNSDVIDVTYEEAAPAPAAATPPPAQPTAPTPPPAAPAAATPPPAPTEPVAQPVVATPVATEAPAAPEAPASAGVAAFDPNEEPPF